MASGPSSNTETLPTWEFLSAVKSTGILTEAQFARLSERQVGGEFPGETPALAGQLVTEGILTEFQASRLLVGQGDSLVVGRYVLISQIGAGAMGLIFKARHQLMDRVVALKVISPRSTNRVKATHRFLREMKLVGLLDHPNVVRAFDAGLHGNAPYFVMEYLSGEDLATLQRARGALPPEEVVGYMIQAARGLAHAHEKGVIHRDIKPSNLFVGSEGNLKILDLGLGGFFEGVGAEVAREIDQDEVTVGTLDYMSPEQLAGRPLNVRTDLYSLGCTMYRLLTNALPFPGSTLKERLRKRLRERHVPVKQARPQLPSDLAAVVEKLLALDPEERYDTASDLVDVLESLISSPYRSAERHGAKDRVGRDSRRVPERLWEPDLPELNTSVIEAALSDQSPAPEPNAPPLRSDIARGSRTPLANELDYHRRTLEENGEETGREVHRQYHAEISRLPHEAQHQGQRAEELSGPAWLERLGEQLGDFLAEPSAGKIVILLLLIFLVLAAALGFALS
jgi:serine/threonine-protein kinase